MSATDLAEAIRSRQMSRQEVIEEVQPPSIDAAAQTALAMLNTPTSERGGR